eukprot:1010038-Rhodomonas_salina.1
MGFCRGCFVFGLLFLCAVDESDGCNCAWVTCPGGQYASICNNRNGKRCTECPGCSSGQYRIDCSKCNTGRCTGCEGCPTGKRRTGCSGTSAGTC